MALMSAPATNAFSLLPVIIITPISLSAIMSEIVIDNSDTTSEFMAFIASGRLIVIIPIPSDFSMNKYFIMDSKLFPKSPAKQNYNSKYFKSAKQHTKA